MDTLKLSEAERLILINQYEILRKLDPKRSDDCDLAIEALLSGLSGVYSEVLSRISPEMDPAIFHKAVDILDMYHRLLASNEELAESEQISEERLHFSGFDGNNESRLMYSATFFVEKMGRYEEIGRIPNTHAPVVHRYDAMLAKLSEYGSKYRAE